MCRTQRWMSICQTASIYRNIMVWSYEFSLLFIDCHQQINCIILSNNKTHNQYRSNWEARMNTIKRKSINCYRIASCPSLLLTFRDIHFIETNTNSNWIKNWKNSIGIFTMNPRITYKIYLKIKQRELRDDNATNICCVIFMFAQTAIFRRQRNISVKILQRRDVTSIRYTYIVCNSEN